MMELRFSRAVLGSAFFFQRLLPDAHQAAFDELQRSVALVKIRTSVALGYPLKSSTRYPRWDVAYFEKSQFECSCRGARVINGH